MRKEKKKEKNRKEKKDLDVNIWDIYNLSLKGNIQLKYYL